jgi:hypothetical protein
VTKYQYDVLQGYMFPTLENLFRSLCEDFETELVDELSNEGSIIETGK